LSSLQPPWPKLQVRRQTDEYQGRGVEASALLLALIHPSA
jgi:hypothetical protein